MSSPNNADLPAHSNDVEEELRRVRLALDTVYAATTTTTTTRDDSSWFQQRQLADRYLTSFQTTAMAWMVCDRLLVQQQQSESPHDPQRRFFAAQTLHRKCRTDVHELPVESLPSLRDSLLQHYQNSIGYVALTTRLAMTLAALSIQMGWTTVVTDVMGAYRHGTPEQRTLLLSLMLLSLENLCAQIFK